ncbi:MAG: VWA domain-containing protein, partial [Bauldia sp.]|nr:VWA domain-containing protein [Bauldia sp.]
MTLVNPAWLLLSGLALLVLLLHMQRRRTIAVPSILLWERLASPVRPRSALHLPPFSWPLVLQVAVVLLVAAAFARPLIGGAPLPDHRIVVIDASGSMRATDLSPSRFAAAIDRAEAMLSAIPPSSASRVSVLTVSGTPQLLAARYAGNRGLLDALAAQAAGDSGTDWAAAADLMRSTLVPGESVSLTILTDNEAGAETIAAAAPDAAVTIVPMWGQQPASNAGLTASVVSTDEEAGEWRAAGTVWFSGETREATVRASFQPEGSSGFLDWGSVEVRAASEAASAPFRLDLNLPGAGILALELPADVAPHDNQLRFVVSPAPRKAQVLHLGPPNEALVRALLASGAVDIFEADALPADDGSFDLVVVDGVAVDRPPATNALYLGAAHVAGEAAPTGIADPVPSHWQAEHILSHAVAWSELGAAVGYRYAGLPGAEVVVEAAGAPLVTTRTTRWGREVRVALELRGAAWSEDSGFPVFIGNVLRWLGPGFGSAVEPTCTAGVPCPLDPRFALGAVTGPDGARASLWPGTAAPPDVLPAGYEPAFVPKAAGLYRLEAGSLARLVAVNPPASEVGLPGLQTATMPPGESQPTPLRWWLLALMLLALLAEAWIAGRGNERFLHRAALGSSSPFHGRRRALLGLRVTAILFAVAALLDLRLPILPA